MNSRRLSPVEIALNVWASAIWHAALGGAGHPMYLECLKDPVYVSPSFQIADRSDLLYDASAGKYETRARDVDVRVVSAIEIVERAFKTCTAPDWLRRYLLFKYPEVGRYVMHGSEIEDDPARAFVDGGHLTDVLGGLGSVQLRRNSVKTLKSAEREFKTFCKSS